MCVCVFCEGGGAGAGVGSGERGGYDEIGRAYARICRHIWCLNSGLGVACKSQSTPLGLPHAHAYEKKNLYPASDHCFCLPLFVYLHVFFVNK